MWVSKSLRSAVNHKYISGILSPDWTRVGYQEMSFLCTAERRTHVTDKALDVSDVCLSTATEKKTLEMRRGKDNKRIKKSDNPKKERKKNMIPHHNLQHSFNLSNALMSHNYLFFFTGWSRRTGRERIGMFTKRRDSVTAPHLTEWF